MSEKRSWIFLRGLGRHSGHWGDFADLFKTAFPKDSVDLLDLAGNGSEVHRESYLRLESYVEDLRRRSQGNRGNSVSILSISMGAMIAAEWAHRHPHEIREMILINTSSKGESRFFERFRPRCWPQVLKALRRKGDLLFREETILRITAPTLPGLENVAEAYSLMPPTTPANFLRQILAASQYRFPEKAPTRTLFLAAQGDDLVDPVCSERLAALWKAPLRIHPSGGHDLPLVDGDWIIEQVREWA